MRRIYYRTPSVVTPAGEGGMILGRDCVGDCDCNRIRCPKNRSTVGQWVGIVDDGSRNPVVGDACILVGRLDSIDCRSNSESTVENEVR